MVDIIFAILLVQAALPSFNRQSAVPSPVIAQGSMRSLELIDADPEDQGPIAVGSRLIRRLTFMNKLGHEILVEVLSTSCGCKRASFDAAAVQPASPVTLTAIVDVAATPGPQLQTVRFKASWDAAEETGVCAIKYEPEIDYEVLPSMIRRIAPAGTELKLNAWVHWPGEIAKPQRIRDLSCSLPGFANGAIRAVVDGPNVIAVQFSGMVPPPGAYRGDISFRVDPADKPVQIPVFLRSAALWVSTPGGVIFDGAARELSIVIKREHPSAEPTAIRVWNPSAPIQVFLDPANSIEPTRTLRVERRGDLTTHGGTTIEVVDADGNVLALVPVAYFAIASEPASK